MATLTKCAGTSDLMYAAAVDDDLPTLALRTLQCCYASAERYRYIDYVRVNKKVAGILGPELGLIKIDVTFGQCYIFLPNFYRQNGHVVSAIFIKNAWPPASWRWSTASKALKASATVCTSSDRPVHPPPRAVIRDRRGVALRRSTGQTTLAGGLPTPKHLTCCDSGTAPQDTTPLSKGTDVMTFAPALGGLFSFFIFANLELGQ
ncbi:unnamed protein product, partial [Iphiclides podalirius]